MSGRSVKAVGAAEFKARCLELIDRVSKSRAEYVVTRHGRPVARLCPADAEIVGTPLGVMRGTVLAYDRPLDPIPGAWTLNDVGDE